MAEKLTIEIGDVDLPLHCPLPGTPLWCQHPRIFLDILHTGHAVCPYCSTHYVFKGKTPQIPH